MKIKSGFVARKIGGKIVAIAVGERSNEFNGIINLNETGQFIWNCLAKDTTAEDVIAKVMKEYEIDEATAKPAVEGFITELKANDLLDE